MIDPEMRKVVQRLHQAGKPIREISRQLQISRNAVRAILRELGQTSEPGRSDKIVLDPELLERLYRECDGWVQRVHEKLVEEHGLKVSYPTLTRRLRELGIGKPSKVRCDRVPDEPGAEMQHDTTAYQVTLEGQRVQLIASLLYLRYSKRRYLKFYRAFNRFAMQCFLHEALMYWGCSARQCIIDNTNLARLRGSGSGAVIVGEMAAFSLRYGFRFVCHAIGHANRKAGEERGFWTVETNFLPGRCFQSLEDLNAQAFEWATARLYHRPTGKSRLIPAKAFEHERDYLIPLPPELPAPYRTHERRTDQYGYVAFAANYYWVPGDGREDVKLLQFADRVKIYRRRELLAEYPLPPVGVKNARFSPEGQPKPIKQPRRRREGSDEERKRLGALGHQVRAYVEYVLQVPGIQRHRLLRELFGLSRQVPPAVFAAAVQRAHRYRIADLPTLRRIAWLCMSQAEHPLPNVDVDEAFRDRPAYQEGRLTDEPDLSVYDVPESLPDPDASQADDAEPDAEPDVEIDATNDESRTGKTNHRSETDQTNEDSETDDSPDLYEPEDHDG